MAVASQPLISGLLDGNIQQDELGFDDLSSLSHSLESSELAENDCGTSSHKLLSSTHKGTDLGFDPLLSMHGSPKASKPTENTVVAWSDGIKLPNYFDFGAEPFSDVMSEKVELPGDAVQRTQLKPIQEAEDLQKELHCADIPSIPIKNEEDGEEAGAIAILEPTIKKEVPASVCRESSSPRLYEEYLSKQDKPSEDTDTLCGLVTECSVSKPLQQSGSISHTAVAARSWQKLARQKPQHQFTCSSCPKLFSSRYELIRHVFVHTDDVALPPHICVMCGEVFATDEEMADHHKSTTAQCYAFVPVVKIRVRSSEEVWFCSTCEQTFETQHLLAMHKAERHLRTVVLSRTELPVSATKLDDLPRVRGENRRNRIGKRPPRLSQREPFHRNYKRKPGKLSTDLQEFCYSNHKRKSFQLNTTPKITVRELLNIKTEITLENPVDERSETMLRGLVGKKSVMRSKQPSGKKRRSPGNLSGEPPNGIPDRRKLETFELNAKRLLEITQGDIPQVASGENLKIKPEIQTGEPVHRINEVTLKKPLNRIAETARGEILDETPEATHREPLNRLSTTAPAPAPESLRIMPGEPFDSRPEITPDSKPKKKRGRPPGSKNKGPSKPRTRKPKTVLREPLDGTSEVTIGKPLHVMRSGECTDRLLDMTPGVPLDEMRSGAPLDRRYGECLYDLMPGVLPNGLQEMTIGEHLYGLHEIGQRDQFYSLHEMTPGPPIDINPDVAPRESLDTTQGEPLYRLHEMTTVESVHRLHEMSPVEILYRSHESTPGSPLDTIPKIPTAEPLSSLHQMTPLDIHYRNNDIKNQESTSVPPLNTVPKITSVEPFDGLPALREPLHKLTEMAPLEPLILSENLHRQSEREETPCTSSDMALGRTFRRPSEIASEESLCRMSEMPPNESLQKLYEMEPRDPLHTLFEMATGDPFHTLFEMEPEDHFSIPSKMSAIEPYSRPSEMLPGQPVNSSSEMAPGNFVNGTPKRRRGRPPGSKNRFPAKPRCKKSKTELGELKTISAERRDELLALPPGVLSDGMSEIVMAQTGDKKSNKNPGETDKWPCHFCHQLFCSLSGLKRHVVKHTGERNYICDLCGKSFARSDNLRVHKYTHTGGLPYKCDVCGRTFSWACHLRDHKRKCQSS